MKDLDGNKGAFMEKQNRENKRMKMGEESQPPTTIHSDAVNRAMFGDPKALMTSGCLAKIIAAIVLIIIGLFIL